MRLLLHRLLFRFLLRRHFAMIRKWGLRFTGEDPTSREDAEIWRHFQEGDRLGPRFLGMNQAIVGYVASGTGSTTYDALSNNSNQSFTVRSYREGSAAYLEDVWAATSAAQISKARS